MKINPQDHLSIHPSIHPSKDKIYREQTHTHTHRVCSTMSSSMLHQKPFFPSKQPTTANQLGNPLLSLFSTSSSSTRRAKLIPDCLEAHIREGSRNWIEGKQAKLYLLGDRYMMASLAGGRMCSVLSAANRPHKHAEKQRVKKYIDSKKIMAQERPEK